MRAGSEALGTPTDGLLCARRRRPPWWAALRQPGNRRKSAIFAAQISLGVEPQIIVTSLGGGGGFFSLLFSVACSCASSTTNRSLGRYKILFHSKVFVHEPIIFFANIPQFGHPTPRLYRPLVYCEKYCIFPTPLYCNIYRTILEMTISCNGQPESRMRLAVHGVPKLGLRARFALTLPSRLPYGVA